MLAGLCVPSADYIDCLQGYVRETVNAAMDTLRNALAKNPFYQAPAEPVKEL